MLPTINKNKENTEAILTTDLPRTYRPANEFQAKTKSPPDKRFRQ